MRALPILVSGLLVGAACTMLSSTARADLVIKHPNDHPDYRVELEPHGTLTIFHTDFGGTRAPDYYRYGAFGTPEFGAGFRASIELVDPGFIPKLNNTFGITFGFDVTNCRYCYHSVKLYLPEAGVQWNFFITDKFSAFADIGFMLRTDGFYDYVYPDLFLMLGARYHFTRSVALTGRFGLPFITVGVSFFI
jgi:hypothetical protein